MIWLERFANRLYMANYMSSAKLKLGILLERKNLCVAGILPAIRGRDALDTNLFF